MYYLARPDWGANDQPLFRLVAPAYSDGLIAPSGSDRPSPRLISEAVMKGDPGKGSDLSKSALVVYFGIFFFFLFLSFFFFFLSFFFS